MKKKLFIIFIIFFQFSELYSQKSLLQSGPMIGYSEMFEVMLWAQTKKEASVKIMYSEINSPETKYLTNTVITKEETGFTAHLLANQVEPGHIYNYTLYINNKKVVFDYPTRFHTQKLWKWRGDAPEFRFATGSCAYINEKQYDRPGEGYGGDYQIFDNIANKKPSFMLWLGDNMYLREPDWNSKTGIIHRYTHTRSIKEMQKLLATTHNYAIWDDHDYGPNNSDKSFWNKDETLNAFKLFWANPSYGIPGVKGAITYFNYADCDFFLLDNRYHRDPNELISDNKTQLGKKQKEWLKNALVYSDAKFKIIATGGQFLTDGGVYEVFTNYGFSKERAEIIDFIYKQDIKNVIFLTGDRHHSEISVLKSFNKPTIYDITTSPLTSHHASDNKEEINSLRVDGSLLNQRNFSVFSFTGANESRILTINFYDSNGNPLFKYVIRPE